MVPVADLPDLPESASPVPEDEPVLGHLDACQLRLADERHAGARQLLAAFPRGP